MYVYMYWPLSSGPSSGSPQCPDVRGFGIGSCTILRPRHDFLRMARASVRKAGSTHECTLYTAMGPGRSAPKTQSSSWY